MPLDRADPARAAGAARLPEPVELAAFPEVSEALTEASPLEARAEHHDEATGTSASLGAAAGSRALWGRDAGERDERCASNGLRPYGPVAARTASAAPSAAAVAGRNRRT